MLALRLTTAATLLAIAASTPLSYHALTDEATGSVLIFPAARSSAPPMDELRGIPMDDAVKKDDIKGFLSSWFKPESRPVGWQQPQPSYQGHYDNYDPYYQSNYPNYPSNYPMSGYPSQHPASGYPSRYPDKFPDKFNKFPDKFNKWNEFVDKFHGLYNDKQDKIHGLYNDKVDKIHGLYYDKLDKIHGLYYDKFDKFDKYGPYHRPPHPAYPSGPYYGPYHGSYHGSGWVGGSHRYPTSDRPYEYGYEGGPYEG